MSFALIVALLVVGFLFVFFEFFVPGGILGVTGAFLMAIGIFLCFKTEGPQIGWIVLILALVVSITVIIAGFKLMPRSPLGKVLILKEGQSKATGYTAQADDADSLLNQEGVAVSDLRPSGVATINGTRMDVMTDGDYIEVGTRVRVVEVASNRIVVRRV
ncbi:MAG TPA: NfeD family protein [bacterium]|nr:NfeD family protein [bacterium]HQL63981.1 NfeD family protein [bacterium]